MNEFFSSSPRGRGSMPQRKLSSIADYILCTTVDPRLRGDDGYSGPQIIQFGQLRTRPSARPALEGQKNV